MTLADLRANIHSLFFMKGQDILDLAKIEGQMIITTKVQKMGLTQDGNHVCIKLLKVDNREEELLIPTDQLEPLMAFALQIDRASVEKNVGPKSKLSLLVNAVEMSLDLLTQNVLFDFHVSKMRFAFSVPREHAIKIIAEMKNLT